MFLPTQELYPSLDFCSLILPLFFPHDLDEGLLSHEKESFQIAKYTFLFSNMVWDHVCYRTRNQGGLANGNSRSFLIVLRSFRMVWYPKDQTEPQAPAPEEIPHGRAGCKMTRVVSEVSEAPQMSVKLPTAGNGLSS